MKILSLITFLLIVSTLEVSFAQSNYVAHEWGTFTSVINKEGVQIQGLHHEEEALPRFVYDLSKRDGTSLPIPLPGGPITKGFTPQAMNLMPIPTFTQKITQKMETPVIYFYSNKEVKVNVEVDFPQGIISQWFPDVTKINPSIEAKRGHASWDVTVLNETRGNLPRTTPSSIWNPSREVRSNIIEAKNQREKLIFYRGLGDFKTPLLITHSKGNFTIENQSDQEVKGLVLLNNRESTHQYIEIESLAPHKRRTVSFRKNSPSLKTAPNFSDFIMSAKKTILKHLVNSGLYRDESIAMLNTWEKGYFNTRGLRLLYVLPIQWTQKILPLKFTPSPKEVIRTLVGRIEILSEQDDKEISNFVKKYFIDENSLIPQINGREMLGLGHFPEPKLRRALQLNFDDTTKEKIKRTITTMNQSLRN